MSIERFLPERCGTPCYKCKKKIDAYGKKISEYETIFYCGTCGNKLFTVTVAQPTDAEEIIDSAELTTIKTTLADYADSKEYTDWITEEKVVEPVEEEIVKP